MEVVVPRSSGFCPGVKAAEKRLFAEMACHDGRISVYGNLINNSRYIAQLSSKNIFTVKRIDELPPGELVAIRTHGIARNEEAALRARNEVLDLTCANVKKVQLKILEHSERGLYVVITGKRKHPEVIGLESYAERGSVIETEADLEALVLRLPPELGSSGCHGVFVVSQTTGDRDFISRAIEALRPVVGSGREFSYFDSICPVTSLKEQEALALQETCDASFVVGDRESSNAARLYERLARKDGRTFFVEDLEALKGLGLGLGSFRRALVVSSASTPQVLEDEIVAYLRAVR